MKTYIINLERSTQRRANILGEVEKHDLDVTIVPAVDGEALAETEFEELCVMEEVRKHPTWLTPGMIGASLSHHQVYRKMLEDGVDAALVLEDDAVLPDDLDDILASMRGKLFENEIVLLHYMSFSPLELSRMQRDALFGNHEIYFPVRLAGLVSAAAYVLTAAAARTMAETVFPISTAPDTWDTHHANGGFQSLRVVYPMPVAVRGDKSTVAATSQSRLRSRVTEFIDERRVPVLHRFLRMLRLASVATRTQTKFVDQSSPLADSNER